MTASVESAVAVALGAFNPRPGFSGELLVALERAAAGPNLRAIVRPGRGRDRWVVAGSIAGVATAASACLYGFVKINRRGTAA